MENNNNIIKIQITKTDIQEAEITLPCYVMDKAGIHYYKLISKDKAIQLYDGMSDFSFSTVASSLAFAFDYNFITEMQFNEIYEKLVLRAQKLITEI